jgi:hypothetical protein
LYSEPANAVLLRLRRVSLFSILPLLLATDLLVDVISCPGSLLSVCLAFGEMHALSVIASLYILDIMSSDLRGIE